MADLLDFVALSYHLMWLGSCKKILHPVCRGDDHDSLIRTGEDSVDFCVLNLHFYVCINCSLF